MQESFNIDIAHYLEEYLEELSHITFTFGENIDGDSEDENEREPPRTLNFAQGILLEKNKIWNFLFHYFQKKKNSRIVNFRFKQCLFEKS